MSKDETDIVSWWQHVLLDQWCCALAHSRGIPFISQWVPVRRSMRGVWL